MNKDNIVINGIVYVPETARPTTLTTGEMEQLEQMIGEIKEESYNTRTTRSIVRCERAGVFFGYLEKTNDYSCSGIIRRARRLWCWSGAASLSQLALYGVSSPDECKFPEELPYIEVSGIIEVIPVTEKAGKSLDSVKIWSC